MIFSTQEDTMYIKTTELKNRKTDILESLKKENYSDKHILRFMKTFDLVFDLVTADICKTNKQLHCWFDRFCEGFNRNTYHSGLDQLVCYLGNGTFEKEDRRPTWMRNPKFDALGPEYRELVTDFAKSATKRGLETSTIKCIAGFGTFFLFSLQQQGIDRIVMIQESHILSFFEKGKRRSFTYHQAIRALFRENTTNQNTAICRQCDRILYLLPKKKNIRKNIQYFTSEEITIIKDALLSTESPFTYRDRAICIIAMHLGLRGSDIRNLKMDSIDWDDNIISLVQQKTTVPLKISLLPIVGNAIYDYIRKERPKGISTPEIFICRKQPYRKMGGMAYSLNVVLDYCGLRLQPGDRRGLHLFRHHLATSLLANDVPVPLISNILGHSQPSSTQAYLSSDLLHLKELGLDISEFPMYKETLQ
jgi:integrase